MPTRPLWPVYPSPSPAALAAACTLRPICLADSPKTGVLAVHQLLRRADRPERRGGVLPDVEDHSLAVLVRFRPAELQQTGAVVPQLHVRPRSAPRPPTAGAARPAGLTAGRRPPGPARKPVSGGFLAPSPCRFPGERRPLAVAFTAARASAVRGLACL